MNRAVISIGSNIHPRANVPAALEAMRAVVTVLAVSRLVRTRAIGRPGQADYLNGAALVETGLSRRALRLRLKAIERRLGRRRSADKSAPRQIDLDIVVWNAAVVDDDVRSRRFLRRAVTELLPELPLGPV